MSQFEAKNWPLCALNECLTFVSQGALTGDADWVKKVWIWMPRLKTWDSDHTLLHDFSWVMPPLSSSASLNNDVVWLSPPVLSSDPQSGVRKTSCSSKVDHDVLGDNLDSPSPKFLGGANGKVDMFLNEWKQIRHGTNTQNKRKRANKSPTPGTSKYPKIDSPHNNLSVDDLDSEIEIVTSRKP
ncbi:hypothetical protein DFH28DRAFT_879342 [Melampsora americana]|nr:hypothetical protein DFH28DRAFT_879342 [Melampsora americana]